MGMVVRTNTMALNAYRQLGMNNSAVSKSLEKLSSGFRINRAGDDAAGLAISEKMKAQITGLETASANAQDGISLIQTAEGNLSEVHDMLNRMVELATKSANGTYTSQERQALQDEVDALLDEVDRISKSANFNGTKLLNGTMGLNQDAFSMSDVQAVKGGVQKIADNLFGSTVGEDLHLGGGTAEVKPEFKIDLTGSSLAIGGGTGGTAVTAGTLTFKIGDTTVTTSALGGAAADKTSDDIAAAVKAAIDAANDGKVKVNGVYYTVAAAGSVLTFSYAGDGSKASDVAADTDPITDAMGSPTGNYTLSFAASADDTDSVFADAKYHGMEVTKNPVTEVKASNPGISLTLDASIVKDGNKLTVDGKTFVFKTDANSSTAATGTEILVDVSKFTNAADQLKEAADIMSRTDGNKFKIDASKEPGTIHIDLLDANKADADKYKTAADLKALFSLETKEVKAATKIALTNDELKAGDALNIAGKTYTFGGDNGIAIGDTADETLANLATELQKEGFTTDVTNGVLTIEAKANETAPTVIGGGLTLQIGDTAEDFNKMTVAVNDMSAKGLGLDGLKTNGIMSETNASAAIDTIKKAINSVSTARAGMGALQNRLEHTINNLDVAVENLSAANSRIRDTDMAKEMMNYTKMNVLVQSAQAMLAQANQQPQSVLQLLQ